MGEELEQELGAEVELIAGAGGVFEVTSEGRAVFSKARAGRFPDPGEIVSLLKNG